MRKLKTSRQPEIVDTALEIASQEGIEAVSMRAVAKRLGLTPMALYGYFRSKEELLDGMIGRILEEFPQPDPALDWRERLTALAHGARAVAHRRPETFPLLMTRPAVTPDAVKVVEPVYQALLDAGVPHDQAARLERLVSTFVLGFAVSEVRGRFLEGTRDPRERRAGFGPEELPAHHRLGETLDTPVDWNAEFQEDLKDLFTIVDAARRRLESGSGPESGPEPSDGR